MTRQIRTWLEHEATDAEPKRWDVLINDKPVPGGYIVQLDDEAFEIHYPHLEPKTLETLEEAKRRIELAPPVTKGDLAVARPAGDDEELMPADEAAELLGMSRFRINAMVANGVLAGTRTGGRTLVSRSSIEARLARQDESGPVGRFAHVFVCYYPEDDAMPWRMAELDPEDTDQIENAKRFVQEIMDGLIAGKADVLNYREAMALRSKAKREFGDEAVFAKPIALSELVSSAPAAQSESLAVG